jgi:hypothetical protein
MLNSPSPQLKARPASPRIFLLVFGGSVFAFLCDTPKALCAFALKKFEVAVQGSPERAKRTM